MKWGSSSRHVWSVCSPHAAHPVGVACMGFLMVHVFDALSRVRYYRE